MQGNGTDEIVVCAWDGMTYNVDQQRNSVRFQLEQNVSAFTAGTHVHIHVYIICLCMSERERRGRGREREREQGTDRQTLSITIKTHYFLFCPIVINFFH